jgi:hypothetical protein
MIFVNSNHATSSESSFNVIPRPEAVLPIGRVLVSSKRTNFPDLTARIIWLSPLVNLASNNSSPSLIVIAATPLTLGLEYFSKMFS